MTSATRSALWGAGIGAAGMFFLDPARGATRRALVRDKLVRTARRSREAVSATQCDLANRFTGLAARTRALVWTGPVDDATLVERVRAALGRVTHHHRAISVASVAGCVTLSGDALESEAPRIVSAVGSIRGVEGVRNQLRTHVTAERIPQLQGA